MSLQVCPALHNTSPLIYSNDSLYAMNTSSIYPLYEGGLICRNHLWETIPKSPYYVLGEQIAYVCKEAITIISQSFSKINAMVSPIFATNEINYDPHPDHFLTQEEWYDLIVQMPLEQLVETKTNYRLCKILSIPDIRENYQKFQMLLKQKLQLFSMEKFYKKTPNEIRIPLDLNTFLFFHNPQTLEILKEEIEYLQKKLQFLKTSLEQKEEKIKTERCNSMIVE